METYDKNGFAEAPFRPILDRAEFKQFMKYRKPKGKKPTKSHLHTACAACFGDISELSNPIIKCKECASRVHKHCQYMGERCHRCRFGRTGGSEKGQTGYCYICCHKNKKGLMTLTVTHKSPHYFAHIFCLLVHNFWELGRSRVSVKAGNKVIKMEGDQF